MIPNGTRRANPYQARQITANGLVAEQEPCSGTVPRAKKDNKLKADLSLLILIIIFNIFKKKKKVCACLGV